MLRTCKDAFLNLEIIGSMAHIASDMRRRRLEGLPMGRAPLAIDRDALVRDRRSMSLTKVAKKYGVSRASVVRFAREALKRQAAQVGEFQPVVVQAPAECAA
jgi:DNA invertase Pin-like site-specific DNA recombinase